MLGRKRRRVLLLAWLTLLPESTPLPVRLQRRAMTRSSSIEDGFGRPPPAWVTPQLRARPRPVKPRPGRTRVAGEPLTLPSPPTARIAQPRAATGLRPASG